MNYINFTLCFIKKYRWWFIDLCFIKNDVNEFYKFYFMFYKKVSSIIYRNLFYDL